MTILDPSEPPTTPMPKITLVAALLLPMSALGAQSNHPLNPLSAAELNQVVTLLGAAGNAGADARFPLITVEVPAKSAIAQWRAGGVAPARVAFAVVRSGGRVNEARVDLTAGRVADWKAIANAETSVMYEEFGAAQEAAVKDPRMVEALAKRGITDLSKLFCAPFTMGYFNLPKDRGMRLLKVGCFDLRPATNNVFGWPIEGLYAIVDLKQNKTVRVYDSGPIPIYSGDANFTEQAAAKRGTLRDPLKPVSITLPRGSNVIVDGNTVKWQNWSFHYRVDRRQGPIVSLVSYRDGNRNRSILHEGAMAEMFVPYMDPDFGWYSRTYFDMGEYGVGLLLSTLHREIDCPASAWFMPVTINDDLGKALEIPDAVCLFERPTTGPAWRHAESTNQTYEGRNGTELVLRTAAAIGNYDYFVDWVFNQNGEIEALVGATGITALKGVKATSMSSATAAADTRYGTLVAPNQVAVNHDHWFNFRLDFDVDGERNRFERDVYHPVRLPAGSARRSIYEVRPLTPATETAARFNMGPTPSKWRVLSSTATNAVGNPTSYEILAMGDAHQLLSDDDYPLMRAGFTRYAFWVTPHAARERYAAGDYPFQSRGGDGLPRWAGAGRSVKNTDIVVWHTVGMHHLPRAEDTPVMPTMWTGFKLRPFNFFDRNPALDLRTELQP
jgi:primary-amine oxidase